MTWTYDPATDILTITYGRQQSSLLRSIESPDAVLDVDAHGGAIRARFFRASQRCSAVSLKSLNAPATPREDLHTLAEAAAQLGVKPFALRHEILAGGMPATRMNDDWYIRDCVVTFYREIVELQRRIVAGLDAVRGIEPPPPPPADPDSEPDKPPGLL